VKRTVLPQGAIQKLSVSVLLDQDVHWEGTGANAKRVLVPPTPERLKVIHDLVTAAAGLNTERGDQLIVESLPFESTLNLDPPAAPITPSVAKKLSPLEQLKSDPKLMIGLGAGVLVLIGGVFMMIRRMSKGSAKPVEVRAQQALPVTEEAGDANRLARGPAHDSYSPSTGAGTPVAALGPARVEVLTNQVRSTAQKDAELCAGVLRGWLRSERA
jgi:flagellar M-ring protein FliF